MSGGLQGAPGLSIQWLGRVAYPWALRLQQLRRRGVQTGAAPDTLWLLEHEPVVTLGRRGGEADVRGLAARGVPVVRTKRGGLATWHGPGQLVGYGIVDLPQRRWGVRRYVHGIEEGLIAWLAAQGIAAGRKEGAPGVYTAGGKIGAIGLHVQRGVTLHGFSLNLDLAPQAYDGLVACGLRGLAAADVRSACGLRLRPRDVAFEVAHSVVDGVVRAHA